MRTAFVFWLGLAVAVLGASAAEAGEVVGKAADATGAALPAALITLRNQATGVEQVVRANDQGEFRFAEVPPGRYLIAAESAGLARETKTIVVADGSATPPVSFALLPGNVELGVTVTATRSEREADLVPLRTDTLSREQLQRASSLSTGDALVMAPGVTPVGSGPMQVRPRLRGLDSTRVLVLVDGERLNNARTATDRAGTEVGLVDIDSVDKLEVASGAGSVLYGTDALSGTVNIITSQPRFTDTVSMNYGLDGFFSSNENGRRGTVRLGATGRGFALQFSAGLEAYDDYHAGAAGAGENTTPFYTSGQIKNVDTIDSNFGFSFKAFPDPFNAPYVRSSSTIPTSGAEGDQVRASGLFALTPNSTLQLTYGRRHMNNVGFPDFEQPVFFSRVTLPFDNFDRVSAKYEARAITPWFTNLKVTGYYQDQRRLLRNEFPVQFPVPSAAFFPINVYRLNLTTDTEQHVTTPGLDAQATFVPARGHVITAGLMAYSDASQDSRTNSTQTTIIGNVAMGARGPQANVFASPQIQGAPSITHPVRVPNASFSDVGIFAQDEWQVASALSLVAGARVDQYRMVSTATPGYEIDSLLVGANPAIPADSLPNPNGDRVSRAAFTGDVGVVYRLTSSTVLRARYGRSYRHPNLEEMLFSGPATVGAIVPNMAVKPEVGDNVDVGATLTLRRVAVSASYFNNTYHGFISTEIVSQTPSGPLSQAINFSDVRIHGVEAEIDAPVVLRPGVVTFFGNTALTRGTVLAGENPLTGASLAGTPQDNISPFKFVAGVRFNDARDRWWVEYGVRHQAEVQRVAVTLIDSPYLIPQDLLGLNGFTVQRMSGGLNFRPRGGRLGLVFAVENLTDRYYREQFQFAPARGRSFTLAFHVR
jgi:hemoglobin/transferrin/lactoferrin receptor protein